MILDDLKHDTRARFERNTLKSMIYKVDVSHDQVLKPPVQRFLVLFFVLLEISCIFSSAPESRGPTRDFKSGNFENKADALAYVDFLK